MSFSNDGAATAAKKPWYRRVPWWGWVLVVVAVLVVGALANGGDQPTASPSPTATEAPATGDASAEQTGEPSEPAAASVTDAEVVAAFQAYIDERAGAGVVIAKAVTDVSFTNRVVRVTFDPAAAGIDQATFDTINPFDNLAEFAGDPIMFDNDQGNRLRPAIDAVETVRADGTPLGTMTTAELYKAGTGEDL